MVLDSLGVQEIPLRRSYWSNRVSKIKKIRKGRIRVLYCWSTMYCRVKSWCPRVLSSCPIINIQIILGYYEREGKTSRMFHNPWNACQNPVQVQVRVPGTGIGAGTQYRYPSFAHTMSGCTEMMKYTGFKYRSGYWSHQVPFLIFCSTSKLANSCQGLTGRPCTCRSV